MDLVNFPHEHLEIVDVNDEVIGSASRSIVHRSPLLIHREVDILIYDNQNRLLFQQRSRNKHQHPLAWSFGAGGHVTAGVTPEEAAIAEMREELGLTGGVKFWKKKFIKDPKNHRFVYFFTYQYNGEDIAPDPKEVEQVKFVSQEEFSDEFFAPNPVNDRAHKVVKEFWKEFK